MHYVNQLNYPSVEDAVGARRTMRNLERTRPVSATGHFQLECPGCGSLVVLRLDDQDSEATRDARNVQISAGGRS